MRHADLIHILALDTRSPSQKFLPSCHVHCGYAFLFAATPCFPSRQRVVEALVRWPLLTSVLPNKFKSVASSTASCSAAGPSRIPSWPFTVAWSSGAACLLALLASDEARSSRELSCSLHLRVNFLQLVSTCSRAPAMTSLAFWLSFPSSSSSTRAYRAVTVDVTFVN